MSQEEIRNVQKLQTKVLQAKQHIIVYSSLKSW
jgi:hypothetical protein